VIFSIDDRLFDLFPGLRIGVLVCRVDNTKYGEDILDPALERTRAEFRHGDSRNHPHVSAWRRAFGVLGIPAATYQNSIESLLNRALKGGVFPRVNPLVDLYTAVSLEFLVPVIAHDLSRLDGNIVLGFAKGTEPFSPMEGGEEEIADKEEVVYVDDRSVLTRRWVWRQSSKVRVTAETRSVFMPVDVMEGLSSTLSDEVMERINSYLTENGSGETIYRNTLDRRRSVAEFTV
jgi:DNA/RNA-binding domain of Phe-tRNA-synthetase-like protein